MKLTDTHSHLYDTAFNADREEALARAAAAGVEHLLLPGIDSESHGALFDLCRRHPGQCVPMMGLHPTSVNDNPHWREELALAERYLTAPPEGIARFCAVGEIGLDFYWDDCPKEIQYQALHDQLQLARELEKPVVIHCRNAEAETLTTLEARGFAGYPLLWHCFGGDADMARRIIRNGWHISIPGPVSYPANKAVREALAVIPDDRLLLETDSPYLSPVPWRGKRNEPAFTVFTVRHMAAARGMEPEELWRLCGDNARRFFGV